MSIRLPQNPGIGGLDELTAAEELFLTRLAGLSYIEGDVLTIVSGVPIWQAPTGGSGGIQQSFETVSANLSAVGASLNYDVDGNITSIEYANGITKTFNYTDGEITSIVLSGSTPGGIDLTKTLSYVDGDVVSISYG